MPADSERMLQLAQSVADGEPVDWLQAEQEARDDEERSIVRRLKSLAALSGVHRDSSPPSTARSLRASDFFIPPAREAVPLQRWAGLEILKKLGEGAFAEVYLARDPKLEREVALKLLKERPGKGGEYRAMLQEARLFAKIRHPNVATVFGAEESEDRSGFWMDRIRGKSLDQLLDERGAFGAREAAGIGVEICKALAAVHGAGLVHRDVKAANVMREEGGRIVLMDFGAGRERSEEVPGNMAGTPLYMAPELFCKQPATAQSDLYALGVLLYQLTTRAYPVEAEDLRALVDAHDRKEMRLLRDRRADLPEGFVRAVERALAHDPAQRFRSAGEMERALVESLGASTVRFDEVQAPSRRGMWIAAAGLAVVAVGAVAFWPQAPAPWTEPNPVREEAKSMPVQRPPEPQIQVPSSLEVQTKAPPTETKLAQEPAASPAKPALRFVAKLSRGEGEKIEAISSGARIHQGERLTLEVECAEPAHLFVFAVDASGGAYPLFPAPGSADRNPIAADDASRVLRMPLLVMGEGKNEKLLVIASREPNMPLQAEANEKLRHKRIRTFERSPLSDEARERRLKARKGVEAGFAKESAILKFLSAAEALPNGEGHVGDFWVRVFELELPARN